MLPGWDSLKLMSSTNLWDKYTKHTSCMTAITFWHTKWQLWRQEKGGIPGTHEKKTPDLVQTGERMEGFTGTLSNIAGIHLWYVIPYNNNTWYCWMTLSILQKGWGSQLWTAYTLQMLHMLARTIHAASKSFSKDALPGSNKLWLDGCCQIDWIIRG